MTTTAAAESSSIFKWETLRHVRPVHLNYAQPVPGVLLEVELTGGAHVWVWRAEDGRSYFCHGLTFGGKAAPGGPVSPFTGVPVETLLREHYQAIRESDAQAGDIVVWRGIAPDTTPHSAVLAVPVIDLRWAILDYSSTLLTKNGIEPETTMTLELLIRRYGESYNTYRLCR